MKKKITTNTAPQAVGPYSQAIQAGHYLFVSGQIGVDPETNMLVDQGVEKQAQQVLQNIEKILQAAGLTKNHVIKTDILLTSINDFEKVNEIYGKFFTTEPLPARQTSSVVALPKDAKIEISCIAYTK